MKPQLCGIIPVSKEFQETSSKSYILYLKLTSTCSCKEHMIHTEPAGFAVWLVDSER